MTFLDPGLEIGSPGDMDLTGDVLIASTGADESHGCWSNDVGPYAGEIQDVANQVIPASGLEVGDGMGLLMTRTAQDQAIPPAPFEPDAETPEAIAKVKRGRLKQFKSVLPWSPVFMRTIERTTAVNPDWT